MVHFDGRARRLRAHASAHLAVPRLLPARARRTYSALGDGSHTLAVRARDAIGNVDPSPAIYSWVVDTVAPTISYTLNR